MKTVQELDKKISIKKIIKWIILVICILIFCVLLENIFQNEIANFDNAVYKIISKFISPSVTNIFKIITNFGGAYIVIIITIIILFFVKNKKYGIYTILNLSIIFIINQILKNIIRKT